MKPKLSQIVFIAIFAVAFLNLLTLQTVHAQEMKSTKSCEKKKPNWFAGVKKDLQNREYHASYNRRGLQAPNRWHNIRTYFDKHGLRIVNRNYDNRPDLLRLQLASMGGNSSDSTARQPAHTIKPDGDKVEIFRENIYEWYRNSKAGLEQALAITTPPTNKKSQELRLTVKISSATAAMRGETVAFTSSSGRKLRYGDLVVLDANKKQAPARFAVSDKTTLHIIIDDSNAAYPLMMKALISSTVDSMLEGNQKNAHLGYSVSGAGDVNGDGFADVIVSAPYFDSGEVDEGAVFVYYGSKSGISNPANVVIESNQAGAFFGTSVSGAGDVNSDGFTDIIVGTMQYSDDSTRNGAAFIYHGSTSGVSNIAAATIKTSYKNAHFGISVSSAGDVNGDGFADVIVGADAYSNAKGAAFVYHGSASGVSTTPAAILKSDQEDARFGASVSNAGDVNGDKYDDIIIGSWLYDNGEMDEGAAFLYLGGPTGVSTSSSVIIESNQIGAHLGISVSSAGDVNADGFADVVVGSEHYDNGETDEGQAFVYHGSASGISNTPSAKMESNMANAWFGGSVSGAGDLNGDGYDDVIVGAHAYKKYKTYKGLPYIYDEDFEGALFIYHGSGTGLSSTPVAVVESNWRYTFFGNSVSGVGDLNGDGFDDLIVGASSYEYFEANEGAAFAYYGSASGIPTRANPSIEANYLMTQFGISVSNAGDVNKDGYDDVIVGAMLYDHGEPNEGAAFVYHGSASGISYTHSAMVESNQTNANMGQSVSGAGDLNGDGYSDVIVGAWLYDHGEVDEGAAFVYHGSASGISYIPSAMVESNQANANLGRSVSGAGDLNGDGYADIIVGAPEYSLESPHEGAAFVYHGGVCGIVSNSNPGNANAVIVADQKDALLGISVSGAGDVNKDGYSDVLIGAPRYSNGENEEGAAFAFHGSASGIISKGKPENANTMLESNQEGAFLGMNVSSAGDVNGDSYADIIIGAEAYDNGETDEGGAFIYHGGPTGISTIPASKLESNQADAFFGNSVSGAGDVNGDGYGDVVVGADWYHNGSFQEGGAFLYHGSSSGVVRKGNPSNADATFDANQTRAFFGSSVSGAGDVNGDGYADVIIGAFSYYNDLFREGGAFVYHGSKSGISVEPSADMNSTIKETRNAR